MSGEGDPPCVPLRRSRPFPRARRRPGRRAASSIAVSSKQAIAPSSAAGYSGVGGVTRNDPYYFAAAISPDRQARARRGRRAAAARSLKVTPLAPRRRGRDRRMRRRPSRSKLQWRRGSRRTPLPRRPAISTSRRSNRRIGVPSFPYNSYNKPARALVPGQWLRAGLLIGGPPGGLAQAKRTPRLRRSAPASRELEDLRRPSGPRPAARYPS